MPPTSFDFATATPDLQLGSLNIFILGREYPEANWLVAAAYCSHPDSFVRTEGSFMRVEEIEEFIRGCEVLRTRQHERAALFCIEQSVQVELAAGKRGLLNMTYRICPDTRHANEAHTYYETIKRSELRRIIRVCRELLERFPNVESNRC